MSVQIWIKYTWLWNMLNTTWKLLWIQCIPGKKVLPSVSNYLDFLNHGHIFLLNLCNIFFLTGQVKTLLLQLLRGVAHLHDEWVLHRDLKTSNLLLSHQGILKVLFLYTACCAMIFYSTCIISFGNDFITFRCFYFMVYFSRLSIKVFRLVTSD